MLDRQADVAQHHQRDLERERARAGIHPLGEIDALHVLHGQIRVSPTGLEVVDAGDVVVVHLRRGPGSSLEHPHLGLILRQFRVEDLEGVLGVEELVAGEVDPALCAFAEPAHQLVVTEVGLLEHQVASRRLPGHPRVLRFTHQSIDPMTRRTSSVPGFAGQIVAPRPPKLVPEPR